ALELRDAGIQTPILVFSPTRPSEIELAIQQDVTLTVFSKEVAEEIVRVAEKLEHQARVHLKIDSGMARLGMTTFVEALNFYQSLASEYVWIVGIYTRLADAPDIQLNNFTQVQLARF